nr:MAG TPA: hypothetical protein [Caudoviricetes sp.]
MYFLVAGFHLRLVVLPQSPQEKVRSASSIFVRPKVCRPQLQSYSNKAVLSSEILWPHFLQFHSVRYSGENARKVSPHPGQRSFISPLIPSCRKGGLLVAGGGQGFGIVLNGVHDVRIAEVLILLRVRFLGNIFGGSLLLGLFGLLLNDSLKRCRILLFVARHPDQIALHGKLCDVGVHLVGEAISCPKQLLGVLAADLHIQPVLVPIVDHQMCAITVIMHFLLPPISMLGRKSGSM